MVCYIPGTWSVVKWLFQWDDEPDHEHKIWLEIAISIHLKISFWGYQPKQCIVIREIPQNYHRFAWFDSPKMGFLGYQLIVCCSSNVTASPTMSWRLFTLASLPVVKAYLSQKTRPFAASLQFFWSLSKSWGLVILWWFVVIYGDLLWFMMIYGDAWWFMVLYDHLLWLMVIYREITTRKSGQNVDICGIDWFTFMKNRKRE